MDVREAVCRRVQQLRRHAGWTQEQLADKARLSVDGIRKIEGRRATPRLETLSQLSGAFNMSLAQLMEMGDEELSQERTDIEELRTMVSTLTAKQLKLAKRLVQVAAEEVEG